MINKIFSRLLFLLNLKMVVLMRLKRLLLIFVQIINWKCYVVKFQLWIILMLIFRIKLEN